MPTEYLTQEHNVVKDVWYEVGAGLIKKVTIVANQSFEYHLGDSEGVDLGNARGVYNDGKEPLVLDFTAPVFDEYPYLQLKARDQDGVIVTQIIR